MSDDEYAAAQRSTLNAHYTDAAYVQAIWKTAEDLGFKGGRVLEPGAGSGNFIAFAPESARVTGVELDPVTAGIATYLHPRADIRNESFAESRFPEGSFDMAVGNVPFGNVTLHDPSHNAGGHAIHNHFILKSLHLTRPGGMVAVLSSRYTMDASNPAARREMAELGDMVGAVRLPSGAHHRAAGTDVVTDLLVFRRRAAEEAPRSAAFERSVPAGIEGAPELRINEYFREHPDHVLGRLGWDQADMGRRELSVKGERAAGPALRAALASIVERARERDLLLRPAQDTGEPEPVAAVGRSAREPDGFLTAHPDGTFTRHEQGQLHAHDPPRSQAAELRSLIQLRETVVTLLEAEAQSVDDSEELRALRQRLNTQYDGYVGDYGPINRFTWRRTGRTDPETGQEKLARVSPPQGGFRAMDPYASVVRALELFDASTQTARKAAIFSQRVVARKPPRLGADTPPDALAITLDNVGEVRLDEVARLLGTEPEDARHQLGTLVFDEPGGGRLVPVAEYLSGNVREKLRAAQGAAAEDPRFLANVKALTEVLPRDLGPDEIDGKLGAAWIKPEYVRQFLAETLQDDSIHIEHPLGNMWAVRSDQPHSVMATSRWGTEKLSAVHIAESLLEQRAIRVYEENPDGARVLNTEATVAAVEKATELSNRFSEWLWEDPERAKDLGRTYNDTFNAIVPRSYDGVKLSLPGLARAFEPRPHQVAAVARIINEPAVGLFHEVGAGKTASMVMGAMELRRLGLVQKPVVVVPNHMLEQFSREWLQLYPQAKVLAASKDDLERNKRRLFVAKVATGDWDGIVMTRSAFERIPMSREAQERYLTREVKALAAAVSRARESDDRFSLKRLERMKLSAEERLKDKLDSVKDEGITFEHLGIDYVFADEAHGYKNLRTPSNIQGMSVDGSQRATDLHMKLEYLRERGHRVATLATATPIANSMGEAYTMQRLLRPDLLKESGVDHFDSWAATFGETTTSVEVSPDGSGLRMHSRFAKFRNVPELLLQWRVSSDIKTSEDLKLPIPEVAVRESDGQRAPETVVVPPSAELQSYVKDLARRADAVRQRMVEPSEDNMLKISSDGRAAALDLRLIGERTEEPQKVAVAIDRIARIYEANRDKEYPSPDGSRSPKRGALQLVFADLGTPGGDRWNVYDALREGLVARGVPREAIRFVHEARNDREKGELFNAAKNGDVAVLIGSTERMGVGTNVQLRAGALHHLDCPWRPADLAQREGRILRQGNANQEVQILRYVTEKSFDAYSWQTVTRKAQFISQVMRGRLDVREIEDIGEATLSYNEVKALATGNPLLLEQASAQAEVTRLERLQRSHSRAQDTLSWTIRDTDKRIERLQQRGAAAEAAIARRSAITGDAFTMTVGTRVYDKRSEAGEALRRALANQFASHRPSDSAAELGTLHGFAITSTLDRDRRGVTLTLAGVPDGEIPLSAEEITKAAMLTRLENRLSNLPTLRENAALQITRLGAEIERARTELGRPFRHGPELEAVRGRLRQLDEQISGFAKAADPVASPPAGLEPAAAVAAERQCARAEPTKPTTEQLEGVAQGEKLEAHWNSLHANELAAVRSRATALGKRLEKRAQEQRQRVTEHRHEVPKRPNAVAMVVGARARYEAAVDAWSKEQKSLEQRQRQLEERVARIREYVREPIAGYPTKGTELAHWLMEKREPELSRQVGAFRSWRQARENERILEARRKREREREGHARAGPGFER